MGRTQPVAGGGTDAILGAGALGLTLALRLAQAGRAVTVFEQGTLPGGLAAGFEIGPGVWLEKFYHHIFKSDKDIIRLIHELGLTDRLEWRRATTATLHAGRPHQLDSPLSLLAFDPLPLKDRLRLGACLAYLRALPNPAVLEDRKAAEWIRKVMGRNAYDVVWGPLLEGKFGTTAEEVALPWFWARVHDRTAELGYLRGGFQRLYEALASSAVAAGASIRYATTVQGIDKDGAGIGIRTSSSTDTAERFERVISTLPTRVTCRLAPALPTSYRERYEWGRAYGAHCLILALTQPLTDDIYWLNVNDPGFPFMALVEHTHLRPPSEYGGRHLVYLGNYCPPDDPILSDTTEAVVNRFLPSLQRINPRFEREWIAEAWAFSAPYAQPIVTIDYRHHIPPFSTPVPGLYVANMFQVYPHDRGQNYSIRLAEALAAELLG